jgi:glucose/arabinose dehydrogenase
VKSSFRSIGIVAASFLSFGVLAPAQSQQGGQAQAQAPQGRPAGAQGQPGQQGQRGQQGQGRPAAPALGDGPWDLQTETGMVHVSVLTKDLQSPWGLVYLPDGSMLVTERPGRLRVIRNGKLDPNPIEGMPDLVATGISGLFGIALHPNFAQNRLIYFAYPKPQGADRDSLTLAVARARYDGGAALADVKDIFVAKDYYSTAQSRENNRCCGQGPSNGSFGARVEFDRENRLYITSGDRNWGEKSQDPQSHIGKILRVNDDGSVPKDNPFVGKKDATPTGMGKPGSSDPPSGGDGGPRASSEPLGSAFGPGRGARGARAVPAHGTTATYRHR